MICNIIVPRQREMIGFRENGYMAECILERAHNGPHLFKTPDEKFFAWEDNWECDCCESDEDERCAIYWEIRETDIPDFQKKQT